MDRLARILRLRTPTIGHRPGTMYPWSAVVGMAVPLAGLALAAVAWLPVLLRNLPRPEQVVATRAVCSDFSPEVVCAAARDGSDPAAPRSGVWGADPPLPLPPDMAGLPAAQPEPEPRTGALQKGTVPFSSDENRDSPPLAALQKGTVPFSSDENRDSPPLADSPVLREARQAPPAPSGSVVAGPTPVSPPSHLLMPAEAPVRSERMETIARQADRQTLYGYELANRGACFAARAEFTAALRLVAQGLDNEHRTAARGQALSAGLTALKEVQDFIPTGAKLEADMNVASIAAGHRTPVLHNTPAEDLRPMAAVKTYFTFAQEQLALAAGHEVAGSAALCALGKLHAAIAQHKSGEIQAAEPKAMVFFQASLLVFPQNYLASNELGVLLAHAGSPVDARRSLEHSVSVYPGSVNLNNLAMVYQQLGQPQLAAAARQRAEAARRVEESRLRGMTGSAGGLVQWVPPGALGPPGGQPADAPRSAPAPGRLTADDFAAPPSNQPSTSWRPWSSGQIQK